MDFTASLACRTVSKWSSFSPAEAVPDVIFFAMTRGRDQGYVPTVGGRAVSEYSLGPAVSQCNYAIPGLADDGVIG
jgi:hypothetical protein